MYLSSQNPYKKKSSSALWTSLLNPFTLNGHWYPYQILFPFESLFQKISAQYQPVDDDKT